ncbi:MAG: hypothetical protein IH851_07735 [Armatimonadetes bacterium]|nr:hypothetical protein [Armatimonadota bacterium]
MTEETGTAEGPDAPYLESAGLIVKRMRQSMDRMDRLLDAAKEGRLLVIDEACKSGLAAVAKAWQVQAGIARGLDPPAKYAKAHEKFVEALHAYAIGGSQMMRALDAGDMNRFDEAVSSLMEALVLLRYSSAALCESFWPPIGHRGRFS